jgi:hypothetical protein
MGVADAVLSNIILDVISKYKTFLESERMADSVGTCINMQ